MTLLTIAFLLIFSPLITESLKISKLEIHLNDVSIDEHKINYLKRDLSIKAIPRSDSSIRGTDGKTYNEPIESAVLFNVKDSDSKSKIPNNEITYNKKETQSWESKYKSLAIVWSVCAVIVLSIGLTVLYIQYSKGNNSTQESLNTNGIQLNSISNSVNLDLDLMSGTHYLNRGVMAFNDITHQILTTHQTNSFPKAKN